jgi:predicted PurR-regulated permease PerM
MLNAANDRDEFKSRTRFAVLYITGVFLALSFIWIARTILLLFFASILCALLLATAVDWAHAKIKIPRSIALILGTASGASLVALGVWLRGSAIAEQFLKLQIDLPLASHKLVTQLQATDWGRWLFLRLNDNVQQMSGFAFAMSRIGGAVLTTATAVGTLAIIFIASLYFASEPETYLKGFSLITPLRYRKIVDECLSSAATQLRWWLLAKLVSMIAVGLLIFTGLWLLDIPLAGTLGMIAACLTFIPNVGPILSAVPASLLAFAISPTKGLLTIAVFCLVHFVEGNFVTPLAEREIVKLPPGLTLAVQLFLAAITGALGIALAAPLTAAASGIVLALLREQDKSIAKNYSMNNPVGLKSPSWQIR